MNKLAILDSIVPNYTEKFLSGQFSPEDMPLLEATAKYFTEPLQNIDLSDVYIVACQHLLRPQVKMFTLLIDLGIIPSHISILPKIYSANLTVCTKLKNLGCRIFEEGLVFHSSQSFDDFHNNQCEQVVHKTFQEVPTDAKIIVLDDGGMLIKAFAKSMKSFSNFTGKIYGVEQTASGRNILLNPKEELPFIVTNVASSVEKITIETDYIVRHAIVRIQEYFTQMHILKSANILVLGKGPIGKTLHNHLLEQGYTCSSYDITDGKLKNPIGSYDVIIGATGSNSVAIKDLHQLKTGTHLISVSSSDREFPSVHIRKNSVSGKSTHDTFVYKEKDIHLANGGFPITFKGCEVECLLIEMDVTKMKLLEGVLLHITRETKYETLINNLYEKKMILRMGLFPKIAIVVTFIFCYGGAFYYRFNQKNPSDIYIYLFGLLFCILVFYPDIKQYFFHKRLDKMY